MLDYKVFVSTFHYKIFHIEHFRLNEKFGGVFDTPLLLLHTDLDFKGIETICFSPMLLFYSNRIYDPLHIS